MFQGQGSKGERGTSALSLTECPRLLKAPKASWGLREAPGTKGGTEGKGERGSKRYVILGFSVPTTSVEVRSEGVREQGSEGSKVYVILGFRVPTTSVGQRAREQDGNGDQGVCYTRF